MCFSAWESTVLQLTLATSSRLDGALVVNPYDLRQASDAMAAALAMPSAEQKERKRSMRRVVSEFNAYRWAGRLLIDAPN